MTLLLPLVAALVVGVLAAEVFLSGSFAVVVSIALAKVWLNKITLPPHRLASPPTIPSPPFPFLFLVAAQDPARWEVVLRAPHVDRVPL
jgi:hypothetical protein